MPGRAAQTYGIALIAGRAVMIMPKDHEVAKRLRLEVRRWKYLELGADTWSSLNVDDVAVFDRPVRVQVLAFTPTSVQSDHGPPGTPSLPAYGNARDMARRNRPRAEVEVSGRLGIFASHTTVAARARAHRPPGARRHQRPPCRTRSSQGVPDRRAVGRIRPEARSQVSHSRWNQQIR